MPMLLTQSETLCPPRPLQAGVNSGLTLHRSHSSCQRLYGFLYALCCLKNVVSLESTMPMALKIFLLPLSWWSLSCGGRKGHGDTYLGLNTTQSLILCPLTNYFCVNFNLLQKSFSDESWDMHWSMGIDILH